MHKFVRGLITEWRRLRLPMSNATVVVSVSGGADSAALFSAVSELLRLDKLELRVVAAHFNHRLRGAEADADEEFVKHLTAEAQIELAVGHADTGSKTNVEENARIERYKFLLKTADAVGAGFVLTAHTKNDQVETFLLNLIRGSGLDGLAAMSSLREMGRSDDEEGEQRVDNGEQRHAGVESAPLLPFTSPPPVLLARPLLSWAKRADTEEYCRERAVTYRYDSMNEDLNFMRVRVRKLLIPSLEEFNPNIVDTLFNTSKLMRHASEAATSGLIGQSSGLTGESLAVSELKDLSQSELYAKLRRWIRSKRGNLRRLELKHMESIERLVNTRKSGKTVELPGGGRVIKRDGRLEFENLKVEKTPSAH